MKNNTAYDSLPYRASDAAVSEGTNAQIYDLFFPRRRFAYSFLKRALDLLFSVILIPLLSPIFAVLFLLVKISSPGKAIFKQTRMGRYGRPFTLYKFRTMVEDAPAEMATCDFYASNQYITKVGKILRQTSLDELPQIFNIFFGNMALVGPRPLVLNEAEIHAMRLSKGIYNLKPGITGLAQVSGRDLVRPEEKVGYDEQYLNSFSFVTDIKIFFKTFSVVLGRKNVVEGGELQETTRSDADPYSLHQM